MSAHKQEPTTFSSTGTVVDHGEKTAPSFPPEFLPPVTASHSTDSDPGYVPGKTEKHGLGEKPDSSSTPSIIPPRLEGDNRTLVLCFDGTGDQFDSDNSNVVQFVSLLAKKDRYKQMVYYQAGIGTYTSPQIAGRVSSAVYKTLDAMVATDLDAHVMAGYEFLMQNYIAGDKICIFGFSRGAYTARSLAGMIHKVGLLTPDNRQQVPFAYKMYTTKTKKGWSQATPFKRAFAIDVKIEFLGVWDTVDSVGLIPKRLPFTTSNKHVRNFRHAVSLDEHRAKFRANLWNRPNAHEADLGTHSDDEEKVVHSAPPLLKHNFSTSTSSTSNGDRKLDNLDEKYSEKGEIHSKKAEQPWTTDIEEVWFAGCHADVGGGSVKNKTPNSLARIPLRWMVRECFKARTGIMFRSQGLRDIGLDPSMLYPEVKPRPPPLLVGSRSYQEVPKEPSLIRRWLSRDKSEDAATRKATSSESDRVPPGSEEEEDLKDALSPIYDQLELKRSWWILEYIPLNFRYQKGNNEWVNFVALNFGKQRFIPKQQTWGVKVHRTVKSRMDAAPPEGKKKKKYSPKPYLAVEPTWID